MSRLICPALRQEKVFCIVAETSYGLKSLHTANLSGDDAVQEVSHEAILLSPQDEELLPANLGGLAPELVLKLVVLMPVRERGAAVISPEQGLVGEPMKPPREDLQASQVVSWRDVVEKMLDDFVGNLVQRHGGALRGRNE